MKKLKKKIRLHLDKLDTTDKMFYLFSLIELIVCLPLALWGNQMKWGFLKIYLAIAALLLIAMLLISINHALFSEKEEVA